MALEEPINSGTSTLPHSWIYGRQWSKEKNGLVQERIPRYKHHQRTPWPLGGSMISWRPNKFYQNDLDNQINPFLLLLNSPKILKTRVHLHFWKGEGIPRELGKNHTRKFPQTELSHSWMIYLPNPRQILRSLSSWLSSPPPWIEKSLGWRPL